MKTTSIMLKAGASLFALQFALAPTAYAQTEGIDEIIVTAQKREESLKDIPLSVGVISASLLEDSQIGEFDDLTNIAPSVTFAPLNARSASVFIRGIGTVGFQSGMEPTISTVLDGVALGRGGSFLIDLADIERIEVLRGPQSTLFGKNASGGVINIITQAPSDEFGGSVEALVAEGGEHRLKGTITGPLAEGLAASLTGFYKSFDGIGTNLVLNEGVRKTESWGVRGKLRYSGERATATMVVDYQEKTALNNIWSIGRAVNPVYAADLAAAGVVVNEENADVATGSPSSNASENGGISLTVDYDLGAATLTSITAYRNWQVEHSADVDGLPFLTPTFGHGIPAVAGFGLSTIFNLNQGTTETNQFSQELRIANDEPAKIDYLAGVFYWRQTLDRFFERGLETCLAGLPDGTCFFAPDAFPAAGFSASYGFFNTEVITKNMSAFGQLTWNVSDRTRLLAGARITKDILSYTFDRPTGALLFPSVAPFTGQDDGNKTAFSGKLSAQYDLNDATMVYASYSRGYKSPAWDIVFDTSATTAAIQPVKEETADAFEMGLKKYLSNGKGFVALSAYHVDFDNYQGQSFDALTNSFRLTSAGKVRTKGLELDLMLHPTDNLSLSGGLALTDAEFVEFPTARCYPGQTSAQGCNGGLQDLAGGRLINSPKFKLNLLGRYDHDFSGPLSGFATLGLNWQSSQQFSLNQNPDTLQEGYAILNASLGVKPDDGQWVATVFVKNIGDKFHRDHIFANPIEDTGLAQFVSRDASRYFGGSLKVNF